MISLSQDCKVLKVSESNPINDFDCGNSDLNEFFHLDAMKYQRELLGETYFFVARNSIKVVCAYTLSNDGMKIIDLQTVEKRRRGLAFHVKSITNPFPQL